MSILFKEMHIPNECIADGFLNLNYDQGMKKIFKYGKYVIYNAFAANDPKSLIDIIQSRMEDKPYILLYNHRNDRAFRLTLLMKAIVAIKKAPQIIVVFGDYSKSVVLNIRKFILVDTVFIENPKLWLHEQDFEQINQVLCIGNIKNKGIQFIELLENEVNI